MSNSLKDVYEDYEAYLALCQILHRYPLPIRGSVYFIDDQKKILAEYGCTTHEELFELINCVKEKEE